MRHGAQTKTANFGFRLDAHNGVPVYRQLINQVQAALASGTLTAGDQLPTVRRVAVDLTVNPNTVARAYREMEIHGFLDTQQGTGTFITEQKVEYSPRDRERMLRQLIKDFISRAGAAGFTLKQLLAALQEQQPEEGLERKLLPGVEGENHDDIQRF
jgi:GntR family transcriptional regulator